MVRTVRDASPDDVPALLQLINTAFSVERFFVDGDRLRRDEIAAYLARGRFLLCKGEDGGLSGCIYVELRGERAYFGMLAVDPAHRREGIGRRLVAAAEELARSAGCVAMDMRIVNLRTELPPIYRRLGYAETGIEPFLPGVVTKLPCHFVRMSKPLG